MVLKIVTQQSKQMPISKKSNIRSRWYRPNEKPLESGTTPQLNEPKGEILISDKEKLIDDLSSAKPNPPKNTDKKRNSNHRNKNRDNNSPEERKPRENRGGREKDSSKRKHSRSKNHRKRNSQNRNSRNNPENSKISQGEKTSPSQKQKTGTTKDKSKSKETKSKLSSFISKLFGS